MYRLLRVVVVIVLACWPLVALAQSGALYTFDAGTDDFANYSGSGASCAWQDQRLIVGDTVQAGTCTGPLIVSGYYLTIAYDIFDYGYGVSGQVRFLQGNTVVQSVNISSAGTGQGFTIGEPFNKVEFYFNRKTGVDNVDIGNLYVAPTATTAPTNTPAPATNTPVPTSTITWPTDTPVPGATATNTPVPATSTNTPVPGPTDTPVPGATNTPIPTNTLVPTNTPRPTNTPWPIIPSPTIGPTSTPIVGVTPTTGPTSTPVVGETPTTGPTSTPVTPEPTPTLGPTSTPGATWTPTIYPTPTLGPTSTPIVAPVVPFPTADLSVDLGLDPVDADPLEALSLMGDLVAPVVAPVAFVALGGMGLYAARKILSS